MQLFKTRDFSDFFTDTFQFIKENATHFFTNFFMVNALFIILYGVYNYFAARIETFDFANNVLFVVLFFIVFLVLGIIFWVFVPVYMILYQRHGTDFTTSDIMNFIQNNIGKIVIFAFASIVIAVLTLIPLGLLAFVLIITIIGIFALPLLMAAYTLWFNLAFMEYLNTDKGYLESLGYAFSLFTKKFWATVGSNAILQIIITVIYYLVLGALGMFTAFANLSTDPEAGLEGFQQFMRSPTTLILNVILMIIMTVVSVNAGIIYFSQKEALEGIHANATIDELGKTE